MLWKPVRNIRSLCFLSRELISKKLSKLIANDFFIVSFSLILTKYKKYKKYKIYRFDCKEFLLSFLFLLQINQWELRIFFIWEYFIEINEEQKRQIISTILIKKTEIEFWWMNFSSPPQKRRNLFKEFQMKNTRQFGKFIKRKNRINIPGIFIALKKFKEIFLFE